MEKKYKHTREHSNGIVKVVLFGPESTGKTTLAKRLAEHYKTIWVPEYMREYLEHKWKTKKQLVSKDDLIPIAQGQVNLEKNALEEVDKVLICDTNLLELKVYFEYYYDGFYPEFIKEQVAKSDFDIYLLTYVDTPWEEDILRDRPHNREEMFSIFEAELKKQGFPYQILKGGLDERLKKSIEIIDSLKVNWEES